MSRRIKVAISLTELETRALLHALGNSIYSGADLDVFGGSPQERHACWRAHNRIRNELNRARRKASGEANSDTTTVRSARRATKEEACRERRKRSGPVNQILASRRR